MGTETVAREWGKHNQTRPNAADSRVLRAEPVRRSRCCVKEWAAHGGSRVAVILGSGFLGVRRRSRDRMGLVPVRLLSGSHSRDCPATDSRGIARPQLPSNPSRPSDSVAGRSRGIMGSGCGPVPCQRGCTGSGATTCHGHAVKQPGKAGGRLAVIKKMVDNGAIESVVRWVQCSGMLPHHGDLGTTAACANLHRETPTLDLRDRPSTDSAQHQS